MRTKKVHSRQPEIRHATKYRVRADRLEAATDQAIAACGGKARDAVKALIVANEYLEAQVAELQADVWNGYARGISMGAPSGQS